MTIINAPLFSFLMNWNTNIQMNEICIFCHFCLFEFIVCNIWAMKRHRLTLLLWADNIGLIHFLSDATGTLQPRVQRTHTHTHTHTHTRTHTHTHTHRFKSLINISRKQMQTHGQKQTQINRHTHVVFDMSSENTLQHNHWTIVTGGETELTIYQKKKRKKDYKMYFYFLLTYFRVKCRVILNITAFLLSLKI